MINFIIGIPRVAVNLISTCFLLPSIFEKKKLSKPNWYVERSWLLVTTRLDKSYNVQYKFTTISAANAAEGGGGAVCARFGARGPKPGRHRVFPTNCSDDGCRGKRSMMVITSKLQSSLLFLAF